MSSIEEARLKASEFVSLVSPSSTATQAANGAPKSIQQDVLVHIEHNIDLIGSITLTSMTVAGFKHVLNTFREFTVFMGTLRLDAALLMQTETNQDKKNKANSLLDEIESIGLGFWNENVKRFVDYVMRVIPDDFQMEEFFFAGYAGNTEGINRRFKELKILFHSDKFLQLEPAYHAKITRIFQEISSFVERWLPKQALLFGSRSSLHHSAEQAAYHQLHAKRFNAAIKIKENPHSNVDRYMSIINVPIDKDNESFTWLESFENLSLEELQSKRLEHASKSIDFFRTALREADKRQLVREQIQFRRSLAVSYHYCGCICEAQLCVIGALNLVKYLDGRPADIKKLIVELQGLLGQLRSTSSASSATAAATNAPNSVEAAAAAAPPTPIPINAANGALVTVTSDDFSLQTLIKVFDNIAVSRVRLDERLDAAVKAEIESRLIDCTVSANIESTRTNVDNEDIYKAEANVTSYKAMAVGAGAAGATAAGTVIYSAWTGALLFGMGGPVTILAVVGASALSYKLFGAASNSSRFPDIVRLLNNIIERAINCFSNGNASNGFEILNELYYDYDGKQERLLEYEANKSIAIDPKKMIQALLKYNFRADGIAYLLNVIGEALMSKRLDFTDPSAKQTQNDFNVEARKIFNEVCDNKELEKSAMDFDLKVYETKRSLFTVPIFEEDISSRDKEEACVVPFSARLQEMRNIAKVNAILLYTLESSHKKAEASFKELKESLEKKYQYFGMHDHRIAAIEDFLYAMDVLKHTIAEETAAEPAPAGPVSFILKWGKEDLFIGNMQFITVDMDAISILDEANVYDQTRKLTLKDVIHRLNNKRHKVVSQSLGEAEPELVVSEPHDRMWNRLRALCPEDAPTAEAVPSEAPIDAPVGPVHVPITELLKKEHIPVLRSIFPDCEFIECTKQPDVGATTAAGAASTPTTPSTVYHLKDASSTAHDTDVNHKPVAVTIGYVADEHGMFTTMFNVQMPKTILGVHIAAKYQKFQESIQKARDNALNTRYWYNAYVEATSFLRLTRTSWKFLFNYYIPNGTSVAILSSSIKLPSSVSSNDFNSFRPEEITAVIGAMECLVRVGKFKMILQLFHYLKTYLEDEPSFWYFAAIASRKLRLYHDASFAIHRCGLKIDSSKSEHQLLRSKVDIERHNIDELRKSSIKNGTKVFDYVQSHLRYSLKSSMVSTIASPNETEYYDVLSIDGGGIRGILPAIILAHIERLAGVPLHKLFHLHAGTSTGAIIATGLSVPCATTVSSSTASAAASAAEAGVAEGLPLLASTLVELYSKEQDTKRIFERTWNSFGLFGEKYTDGRKQVIETAIDKRTTLGHAKNDLLVMAARKSPSEPCAFTNSGEGTRAMLAVDAAMASSAAPTFFKSHVIDGVEYVDGGMVANHPAKHAWRYAKKRAAPGQKIRLWSIGTGSMFPDFSRDDSISPYQGTLYWADKALALMMDAQVSECDRDCMEELGDDYHRWQIWLDEAIAMDDISEKSLRSLVELALQFIRDHNDEINRLVTSLLTNRGYHLSVISVPK